MSDEKEGARGVHASFQGLMDAMLSLDVEMALVHRLKRNGFTTVCGATGQDTKYPERVTCPSCKGKKR